MNWLAAAAVVGMACALAAASGGAHAEADEKGYADEDRDWGVAPTHVLRRELYHAPTPRQIPGAQVVRTRELQAMLASAHPPLVIDVLSEEGHVTLPGALWLSGAGRGANFVDPVQSVLEPLLKQFSAGDKARPMVFFCASSQCWLSYNAALRAAAAGYRSVYWYRGGIEAWVEAGLPTARATLRR